jgi:hypothetical protein
MKKIILATLLFIGCYRSHVFDVMLQNGASAYAVECDNWPRCQEEIG